MGLARDISERLLVEDELRSTSQELQKEIQTQKDFVIHTTETIQKLLNEGQTDKASTVISNFLEIFKMNKDIDELHLSNFNFEELVSQIGIF